MREIRHNSLLVAAALLLTTSVEGAGVLPAIAEEQPTEITGVAEAVPSPDGRLELVWRRNETQYIQEIWVRPSKDSSQGWLLYSFIRSASVLWSPNGRMVAITDRYSSNESRVVLFYFFNDTAWRPVTALSEAIEKFFDDKKGQPLFSHSHARAVRWSPDSKTLQVRLHAYDALDGTRLELNKLVDVVIPVPSAGE
jgi:hypothetical protein